jgi:tetratricopeptide (TPR) repeat protein
MGKSYEHANAARQLEPESAEALGCYGTLLLKDGEIDDAIAVLQKASTLNPQNYLIHNNLAYAYDFKGDKSSYYQVSKTLYQLRPNFKNARRVFAAYHNKNGLAIGISLATVMLIATIFRIQALFVLPGVIVILGIFISIEQLIDKKYAQFRRSGTLTFIFAAAIIALYWIMISE